MGRAATLSIEGLENEMSILKSKMISNGLSKGLTHPDTIKYSQELDLVINAYIKMKQNNYMNLF